MLTWKCHVCGRERPDDKISVITKPLLIIDDKPFGQQHIRYCNDNPDCIAKAPEKDFMKGG